MKNIDLRIEKNNKLLVSAFIKLLERKSFEDISVVEICNEALVSRSAFYDHFKDKYDFASHCVDYMYSEITLNKDENEKFSCKDYILKKIEMYLTFLEKYKINYKLIRDNNNENILKTICLNNLKNIVNAEKSGIKDDIQTKLYIEFVVAGISALFDKYLLGEIPCSKEELLEYFKYILK